MGTLIVALLALLGGLPVHQASPQAREGASAVFRDVERALASAAVSEIEAHLGDQVTVSIERTDLGYVSANQATSILNSYFALRKPTSFTFSRTDDRQANPFATGRLYFVKHGTRGSAQVYVCLARRDSTWVISQLNFY